MLNWSIDKFAFVTLEALPDGARTTAVESLDFNMTLSFERPSDLVYNGDLDATEQLAIDMKNELLRGNLDEVGRLLDEGWQHKKQFTDGISNERIDAFYRHAREAGALGVKLLGAGGGGSILLFCDVAQRARVAKAALAAGGRVTDFSLEMDSLQTGSVLPPH